MDIKSIYATLPYELSGSRAKNRFRLELLWGISKMFDLFDESDFCVVFDYACDIEVHLPDALEFYQVKTHKVKQTYSFAEISKITKKKNSQGNSIFGKLLLLKRSNNISVTIVSNAFFKYETATYSDIERLDFSTLDDAIKRKITEKIAKELEDKMVDLSNTFYLYTSMDLNHPEDAITGKIARCFEKIKSCEPIKPNALYRLIRDAVEEKASYELSLPSYEDIIKSKGISKSELDAMLELHIEKADTAVDKIRLYIESAYKKATDKKRLKASLAKIVEARITSRYLQEKETEISAYINKIDDDHLPESEDQIADLLMEVYGNSFAVEYAKTDVFIFMLLIVYRWEDGKYE